MFRRRTDKIGSCACAVSGPALFYVPTFPRHGAFVKSKIQCPQAKMANWGLTSQRGLTKTNRSIALPVIQFIFKKYRSSPPDSAVGLLMVICRFRIWILFRRRGIPVGRVVHPIRILFKGFDFFDRRQIFEIF